MRTPPTTQDRQNIITLSFLGFSGAEFQCSLPKSATVKNLKSAVARLMNQDVLMNLLILGVDKGYSDVWDLEGRLSIFAYPYPYMSEGLCVSSDDTKTLGALCHEGKLVSWRNNLLEVGARLPAYSAVFSAISASHGRKIEISEPETHSVPECCRLNGLWEFLTNSTLKVRYTIRDKIRYCKLSEYEAGRHFIVISTILAAAAAAAGSIYGSVLILGCTIKHFDVGALVPQIQSASKALGY